MSEDPVEQLLTRHGPDIEEVARRTRALVLELLPPGIVETAQGDWLGYGTDAGYRGLIATMSTATKHVTLGINGGASLPDPHGLMEGKGAVHKHIKLRTTDDVDRPGVRELILAAAETKLPG
jgi:hypothetical protein